MVRMNYESAKLILKNGGRQENSSGTYSIVGRIIIPDLSNERTDSAKRLLLNRINEHTSKMYSYEFKGDEPLSAINFIEEIIKKYIPGKKYTIFTSAPINYWWKGENEEWRLFDSIIVRRFAVNDLENDKLLGTSAITEKDYKNMTHELKEKITFLLDLKKSNIRTEKEFEEYVKWVRELGIKEIIVCENDDDIFEYNQKMAQEMKRRQLWQVEQLKSIGDGTNKPLLRGTRQNLNMPLSIIAPQILLKAGMHLQIIKSMLEGENLYKLTTLKNKDFQVVFRRKVVKGRSLIWESSRSHKYVCEI